VLFIILLPLLLMSGAILTLFQVSAKEGSSSSANQGSKLIGSCVNSKSNKKRSIRMRWQGHE
jgi:hypothetical protein